jgi:hypothetical protein
MYKDLHGINVIMLMEKMVYFDHTNASSIVKLLFPYPTFLHVGDLAGRLKDMRENINE